jgi:hypothetical protein
MGGTCEVAEFVKSACGHFACRATPHRRRLTMVTARTHVQPRSCALPGDRCCSSSEGDTVAPGRLPRWVASSRRGGCSYGGNLSTMSDGPDGWNSVSTIMDSTSESWQWALVFGARGVAVSSCHRSCLCHAAHRDVHRIDRHWRIGSSRVERSAFCRRRHGLARRPRLESPDSDEPPR